MNERSLLLLQEAAAAEARRDFEQARGLYERVSNT
jgi:hypothetical protein